VELILTFINLLISLLFCELIRGLLYIMLVGLPTGWALFTVRHLLSLNKQKSIKNMTHEYKSKANSLQDSHACLERFAYRLVCYECVYVYLWLVLAGYGAL
jgi:hypothetical protein